MAFKNRLVLPIVLSAAMLGILIVGLYFLVQSIPDEVTISSGENPPNTSIPGVVTPSVSKTDEPDIAVRIRNVMVNSLSRINAKVLMLIIGITIMLIVVIIIIKSLSGDSLPPVEDSNMVAVTKPLELSTIVLAIFALVCIVGYFMPSEKMSLPTATGTFRENPVSFQMQFSSNMEKALLKKLQVGESIELYLGKLFDKEDIMSLALLFDSALLDDFTLLLKWFSEHQIQYCMEDGTPLKPSFNFSNEYYPAEFPTLDMKTTESSVRLEVAHASEFLDPVKQFTPKGIAFSYAQLNNFHFFVDCQGRYMMVGKGDQKAAYVAGILASLHVQAGCSLAASGKQLIRNIQLALKLFCVKESLSFTIVNQTNIKNNACYIDVIQAGLMNVSVYSHNNKSIADQTHFAQEDYTLSATSDTSPINFYRFAAKQNDSVLIYSNAVAYNVFAKMLALSPRAIRIASISSYIMSQTSTPIHIPFNADQPELKTAPKYPSGVQDVLVVSRLVK